MTAYVVFIRDHMKDEELFKKYSAASREARGDHPVTPLAYYGEVETLEGKPADGVVIASFPTAEAARAWYFSDAYQAAKAIREEAADYRVVLVSGVD
jgi:uncharacterized protein (DUF1330 family)